MFSQKICIKALLWSQVAKNFTVQSAIKDKSTHHDVRTQHRNYSRNNASKSALVVLAQGAEEMETVITVDMLRRAGVVVTLAGLDGDHPVICTQQVTLTPDKSLADALYQQSEYDAVILPGGLEGTNRLCESATVGQLLRDHYKKGKIIAAICAAPTAFLAHKVARFKRVTSYPTVKELMIKDYDYVDGERVVVDDNVITSRGPGTTYWFALAVLEQLVGFEKTDEVEMGIILSDPHYNHDKNK